MSYAHDAEPLVKYVPVAAGPSHAAFLGYLFWLVGFTGAHRFYFGRPLTGILWFFTLGLLGIGWLVDAFLIPSMSRDAGRRYPPGRTDYHLAWVLFYFGGLFGLHRFYQGKILTGLLYLFTLGLFGIGWLYDCCTLNEQIAAVNRFETISYQPVWR